MDRPLSGCLVSLTGHHVVLIDFSGKAFTKGWVTFEARCRQKPLYRNSQKPDRYLDSRTTR